MPEDIMDNKQDNQPASQPENQADASEGDNANDSTGGGGNKIWSILRGDLLPLLVLFVVVFLVIIYANDWKFWDGMVPVEVTNDAYVRADVTPLSTKVSGTIDEVYIDDYAIVKKGQLLFQLRNDDFKARVQKAHALYNRALANIDTVKRQIEAQDIQIRNAAFLMQAGNQDVSRLDASSDSAAVSVDIAGTAADEAQALLQQAREKLVADQAQALRASLERKRQEDLYAEDASTHQTIEQVVADNDRANALVRSDQAEIVRINKLILQRQQEKLKQEREHRAAAAGASQSKFAYSSKSAEYDVAIKQKSVLEAQLGQAQADAEGLKAAWQEALVELDYTKIVAPVDGVLSERRVRRGQQVNAGTQVITIVSAVPWVIANYRETQMHHIVVGDRAEVSVDAMGGAKLKGVVISLSPASEAQFALLPPDNPSGNFTKITQRLPLKIKFDAGQDYLSRIKPGMTVIARVWASGK